MNILNSPLPSQMTKADFEELMAIKYSSLVVNASDLSNQEPRTLLWGNAHHDKHGYIRFHVYLDEKGFINTMQYAKSDIVGESALLVVHDQSKSINVLSLHGDKSFFPHCCDTEFVRLVQPKLEYGLSLFPFNENAAQNRFYALRIENFSL